MKKAFAMILIILCLLSAAAPAETWTIAPIETPEGRTDRHFAGRQHDAVPQRRRFSGEKKR